ncbi:spore germination protein [Paenibacillus sp. V4I7]|uniref:spore germination protein n=1 Tax=Paenibacillus sp. V4I7 TaxID=3042307 RepID=UPI0027882BC0|nr:spore germination protein [Paenibacillus sp. V4I7]MDQ0899367.1 hypothetical protein [Paenibacillus sp. V4I7]
MNLEKNDEHINNLKKMANSSDFIIYENCTSILPFTISYFKTLINPTILHESILPLINLNGDQSLVEFYALLPFTEKLMTAEWEIIEGKLLRGYVVIYFKGKDKQVVLVDGAENKGRSVQQPEIEFSVVGPKEALVESLEVNLNLIRRRLPVPNLKMKELSVGSLSKSKVVVCYLEGITNEDYVRTVTERIEGIDYDFLFDTTMLSQMIEGNTKSIFPQLLETERPDRICSGLGLGQVAILMDGSPDALLGPVSLNWFFVSYEDYYLPWNIASFFRLIRIFAIIFSISASSLYVAVTTYHYEVVSTTLLSTLISSRATIPLPPVIEAIIMELTIELLREAGARLPARVGQTIGIVGGIVIGTAAVQASLTSNILLIIVGLSALASFTTPIFRMSTTIRLLRYPLILAAQWLGLLGIFIISAFILIHLLRLKTLGSPYLAPIYPFRRSDLNDSLVRLPFSSFSKRPSSLRTQNPSRISSDLDEE